MIDRLLTNNNILLISPEPWDHIFVSKHHYARTLASLGNQVVFANPPKADWNMEESAIPGLRILDYPKFVKGLRTFPAFISRRIILSKFRQIEQFCGCKFDVIWSFDNSVFFDFTLLPAYAISHIVDLNQDFETAKAAKTADICFYTTELIGDRLRKYTSRAHFINHGYNAKSVTAKRMLPGRMKHKVMYAGNLNMPYLDWENMRQAIEKNEQSDFIFIGPQDRLKLGEGVLGHFNAIESNERAHFVGRVQADELPDYYASADVLIICYQEAHHTDQSNPHKMMEYLGTGKAIVATYTATFSQYAGKLICMSTKNAEFGKCIKECLENLEEFNSEENQQARRALAMDNSYERQIQRIQDKIEHI